MPGLTNRHRHRAPRGRPSGFVIAGAVVAVLATAAAVTGAKVALGDSRCTRNAQVRIAADGPMLTMIRTLVPPLAVHPDGQGGCVQVVITQRAPAELAAEIGRRSGTGLGSDLPDVWVPDSSAWLAVARGSTAGAGRLTRVSASVAVTPVVAAMPRPAAVAAGWPGGQPDWRVGAGLQPPGLADPSDSTATLAALLAAGGNGDPTQAVNSLAQAVTVPRLGGGSPADVVGTSGVGTIATTEADVVIHNRAHPGDPVAAVYDRSLAATMDFPFVRVASGRTDTAPAWAVNDVERAMRGSTAVAAAQRNGLRAPSGGALPLSVAGVGALPVGLVRVARPSDGAVLQTLQAWDTLGRRSRALLVMDVSGSMAAPLPGSTSPRINLAKQAMAAAIASSPPDADLGLWSFTSSPTNGPDYRRLVDVGPLFSQTGAVTRRQAMLTATNSLQPARGGGTGLYDTTLAAFEAISKGYVFGRLNAVVLLTDGKDEDLSGISLNTLLNRLRLEFDGVKPVRVITIAYGESADASILIRISDVTGARSYRAVTPAEVAALFREALATT